eukprot:TRINITY_DN3691_c0_g3_i1.p1 TRINITY_DN3691_c0_g3~~TRINITY_DN3691_c0_g3_i1.p1  ORF type:complete len:661 (+),score=143.90 TRINITY_DN3691_c0_g3_i1:247-2229(+)
MEDSTLMTIEFLRARLLSERSVSRTARQRADQLAKKVMELEEQLKIASIQRKKAEKATAEVLAILENNGISDFSEPFDSSSDHDEVLSESKEGNNLIKEEETLMTSKARSEMEDGLSGSEIEASPSPSPSPSRSLSWKSSSNNLNTHEKKKSFDQGRRRQSSFVPAVGLSSKQQLGKSCRKIKRREMRSGDVRDASPLLNAQENRAATGLRDTAQSEEEKVIMDGVISSSLENLRKETDANGCDRDVEMERALERQAELIDRYEAEENAQREWEEKFRENNNRTPDFGEPGSQSDVTEERNEPKAAESADLADTIHSNNGANSTKAEKIDSSSEGTPSRTLSNGFMPTDPASHHHSSLHAEMRTLTIQEPNSRIPVNELETDFQGFSFPGQEKLVDRAKGKQKQGEWSENKSVVSTQSELKILTVPQHGFSFENQSKQNSSFQGVENSSKGDWSGSLQIQLHRELQQAPNGLGGVLEALQHAKSTLKRELKRPPIDATVTVKDTRMVQSFNKARDTMEIPLGGYAGLFRLPTDLGSGASSLQDFSIIPHPDFGPSLTRHSSNVGVKMAPGDRYPTNPYMETDPRVSIGKSYFDRYLDTGNGLPSANRYAYPYGDLTARLPAQIPSDNGFLRPYLDARTALPDVDRYSVYDDMIKPNIHKQ